MNAFFPSNQVHLLFHGSAIQISVKALNLMVILNPFPTLKMYPLHIVTPLLVILILIILLLQLHYPFYINPQELSLHQLIWQIMCVIILLLGHQNLPTQVFPTLMHLFSHLIIYLHHIDHFLFMSQKVLNLKLIQKHDSLNIG